jgi:predicted nuclease of restriction endonuclease-like (RecB) superfamily
MSLVQNTPKLVNRAKGPNSMKRSPDQTVLTTQEYRQFIEDLKARVGAARTAAARSVNRDLILLYWDIGRGIVEKQQNLGWGDAVVENVASDLQIAFPAMTGFSTRNVWDMRRLYEVYSTPDFLAQIVREVGQRRANAILRQAVAELEGDGIWPKTVAKLGVNEDASLFLRQLVSEIPWGQNLLIMNKVAEPAARLFYLRATAQFGWSRNVLLNQIKAGAYERAVTEKKIHNFPLALPEHLAEQAQEMMKSSYSLEFLGIRQAVKERDLEDRLISRLQAFLLELGYGFCFVGRQHRLTLGKKEYFVDLLFYHRFLKALVAFELKVGPFEPEHAGKMDFYLNLLNDQERGEGDQPSIGIILCAEKDDIEVEYALRTKTNPIGVTAYQLQSKLPSALKGKLPTAKQLSDVVRAVLPVQPGNK